MTTPFKVNDTVQFTEEHKWVGCFGTIEEIKDYGDDIRYMIGVPIPSNDGKTATAYIFEMESDRRFEYIGRAVMVAQNDE